MDGWIEHTDMSCPLAQTNPNPPCFQSTDLWDQYDTAAIITFSSHLE